MKTKTNHIIYYLPLILLLVYGLWTSFFFELHDFANAYFGAVFLRDGIFDARIYDALFFNEQVLGKGFEQQFVAYYPNTPFLAFFFLPFTFFEEPLIAKLSFNLLSVLLFVIALIRLLGKFNIDYKVLLALPIIFLMPIRNNILFGQVYLMLFFLLSEGFISYSNRQNKKMASYWGLAILLKVFPILLGLFLLVKNAQKALLFLGVACLGWLLFSCFFVEISAWSYYFFEVLPRANTGHYYDGFTAATQSPTMLFKNVFVEDAVYNSSPFYNSTLLFAFAESVYKSLVISSLICFSWRRVTNGFVELGWWIMGCLLLAPGWTSYSAILLLFPLLSVWINDSKLAVKHQLLFSFLVFLYCNLPIPFFLKLPLLFQFPKVYLLLFLFGYYRNLFSKKGQKNKAFLLLVIGLVACFMLVHFNKKEQVSNNYLVATEKAILISNYELKLDSFQYEYWDIPNPKLVVTDLIVKTVDSTNVFIRNNQIFYQNQQLTDDNSNKIKPLLINGSEVVYLSDKGRGIGFYTLLKVSIP